MTYEIKEQWEDCTIGFECPECGESLIADSQSGVEECPVCGLKYYLSAVIKIVKGDAP